jgi:phospholipid/cholesterol/gamma-HCH transport system substrate-binding protein
MASLKTKFSVGLFLIIGITFVVAAVVWLGMSNYFEKGRFFVAYFDETVQGLDKDAPVKYRGVSIGRVHHIGVAPDERLIEVIMKIESEMQPQYNTNDIVAQLSSVGITGLMFIELERKPPDEEDLSPEISFNPPYPVIPTRPSEISKFFQGIEDVFNLFRALDTETISNQIVSALQKINHTIDEARLDMTAKELRLSLKKLQELLQAEKVDRLIASIEQTSKSLNRMAVNADDGVSDIRKTVGSLDRVINGSGKDVQAVTADLRESSAQVRRAMQTAASLMENTNRQMDTLQRQVLATLNRIDQAGQTLNLFLERIANQPSQMIFSQPAQEKPTAP